jgi:hypothetical protein
MHKILCHRDGSGKPCRAARGRGYRIWTSIIRAAKKAGARLVPRQIRGARHPAWVSLTGLRAASFFMTTQQQQSDKPPTKFEKRFVLIDPLAVDKSLLYSDSSGKFKVGLILETERDQDGKHAVRQAAPAKLTARGVRGKVVGWWKFCHPKWDDGKTAKKAALPKL